MRSQVTEAQPRIRTVDLCAGLRRASRAVTRLYDLVLAPTGLKSTQFLLLDAIARCGEIAQWRLADEHGLADDTLSRRVTILRKAGLVHHRIGTRGNGERLYKLTTAGEEKHREALPYWHRAQHRLQLAMGDDEPQLLLDALDAVCQKANAAENLRCSNGIGKRLNSVAA